MYDIAQYFAHKIKSVEKHSFSGMQSFAPIDNIVYVLVKCAETPDESGVQDVFEKMKHLIAHDGLWLQEVVEKLNEELQNKIED